MKFIVVHTVTPRSGTEEQNRVYLNTAQIVSVEAEDDHAIVFTTAKGRHYEVRESQQTVIDLIGA